MCNIKSIYKQEFDLYDDIFKISYDNNGIPYSKVIPNAEMVKEIIKRLKEIWYDIPKITRLLKNESDEELSCLILASKSPHITLPSIYRNALISEKILIPHPMLFYLQLEGEESPYFHPEIWEEEFMKSALYICALRDWIADDIIRLIPMPSQWSENIKNRVKNTYKKEYMDEKLKNFDVKSYYNTDFIVDLLTDMDDEMREFMLMKMKKEGFSDYDKIVNDLNKMPKYPSWMKINTNSNTMNGQMWHTGTMLQPIEIEYLINNWNIYVNPLSTFMKDRLAEDMKTKYNVVSNYIDDIKICFPKNLPLKYIYDCRKNGTLNDFRKYMSSQYEKIRDINKDEDIENIKVSFKKTIDSQLEKMNDELREVQKDIGKHAVEVALSNVGTAIGFCNGNLSLLPLINIAGNVLNKAVPDIRRFKKHRKNPLIVLYKIKK